MKLFIDSSTNYLYLALYDKGKEMDNFVKDSTNHHSETLIELLKSFLKKNDLDVNNLDSIFVGRGPGSYTGVRISGTIAKVLALVKSLPLYSFSSLDLMMVSRIEQNGKFLTRIIAKKNHSYYKRAKISNHKVVFESNDTFSNDEMLEEFKDYSFVEVDKELFQTKNLSKYLIDFKLYKEEDVFNYVPNYLRSEING